jgi:hypothetical protein
LRAGLARGNGGGVSAGRGRLWALVGVVGLVLPAVESPMLTSFAKSSGVVFWNPTTVGCGWVSDTWEVPGISVTSPERAEKRFVSIPRPLGKVSSLWV